MRPLPVLALAAALSGCATYEPPATVPATAPREVVIREPARSQIIHEVAGTVRDVNRAAGEIRLDTPDGRTVEMRLPVAAVASIREGDRVRLNIVLEPR